MIRYLPLLVLFAADPVRAESAVACFPGMPWCNGVDIGLAWIPIVVGLQLAFLYFAQGGPAVLLGRFAGYGDDWADQHWGMLQVGLPIALVMAFPALAILVVVGKWLRPVGLIEIVVVQGGYWLLLAVWLRQTDAGCAGQEIEDAGTSMQMPELLGPESPATGFIGVAEPANVARSPIDAGVASILPRAALDGIPLFPGAIRRQAESSTAVKPGGASASLMHPERVYAGSAPTFRPPAEAPRTFGDTDNKALINRLTSIYMWDDIGTGQSFKLARKLPLGQLLTEDDRARYGEPLIDAMRCVARHTVALYRYGVDTTTFATILSSYSIDGFDEYSADLMQRLTYSVLFERQKLFIDQTDIEIFGDDFLVCLYRLALYEAQSVTFCLPATGVVQGAAGYPALQ